MDITVRGKQIGQDSDGYLSLTDMWRVSGEPSSKTPPHWRELPTTRELTNALYQNIRFSDVWPATKSGAPIYSKSGKGGGTYAHHILALAYAEYLNPEIGVEVRDIALRYWAGDIGLFDHIMHERHRQADTDQQRVLLREEIREHNQELQQRVRQAGGTRPHHFAEFHNAGYRGLYDGLDENAIHKRKGLKKDQRILDYMMPEEAAANWFKATQAEARLRREPAGSVREACDVHKDTGQRIRSLMAEMGNTMPEDVPVADSISDARKRLREYRKSQDRIG